MNYIDPSGHNEYLKQGSRGDIVRETQEKLIAAGYSVGKCGADGIFGKDTLAAVIQYQRDHNLTVDGIVGSQTMTSFLCLLH